ncbi:Gfo/Idh/MocA family protein [Pelagibacterium halotolerans]|uniref:Oxidoreductase-like protein n=1 Tax=Pelagibacterium halotolerans (strain DSM 22347 / JCM 15775 / CGMCC 1.7692 / B2) TaxID=1082931 RepID=G4RAM2_PELHB|nr:Gfo/Idh/MocA family oxidoreductase [Pelagibacterium halotolerans]AEQ52545.1 oxidoreductase-like protein [Pelagibacterium halotolerans B2]QJR17736.1 Gfo/Idh/MocA family oxidoreductase [Pelagibacterium halotolerans]SEA39727.1 Predicted dehydrogenase [Pelagibacterium halotolerans]
MLNIAILGPGNWAKRLVGSVQGRSESVRFSVAGSRAPERHADFGAAFGIPVVPYASVYARENVDAVLIATPHSEHRDQAIAAARAGKHVFCEKPLALSAADADAIIAECDRAGVVLAHGFNRRFAPAYLEMARRIGAGELGTLLHIEGQFSGPSGLALKPGAWRATREQCPAGAMTARGIHALDTMIALAGPVSRVFAQSDRRVLEVDVDDVTSGLLRFAGGVTGYIASHHATAEIWRIQAYGTKGWLEMRSDNVLTFSPTDGANETVALDQVDKERSELEAFAAAVGGTAAYPVTSTQARNGIAVLQAMAQSAVSGQPVDL